MNPSSYQSILQSSLVAHQSAVDKINSVYEEGQAAKEQISLAILPVAHVFLQSGLDKSVNLIGKQLAKRTGSKVIQQASDDYAEGGGQRVIEGFLNRRLARNRVSPQAGDGEGETDNLLTMDDFGEDDFVNPMENFIPSQGAIEDNVDDIEEMFAGMRQSMIQETNLDEMQPQDDGSEIQPAEEPEEEEDFDTADEGEEEDTETPDTEAPDTTTAQTAETASADVDDALDTTEAVSVGLDADPVTAVAGIAIGVGTILASIFLGKSDHPTAPQVINPSFQQGA